MGGVPNAGALSPKPVRVPAPRGLRPGQIEINRTFRSLENNRETLRILEVARRRLQKSQPTNALDELGFKEHLNARLDAIDSAIKAVQRQIECEQTTIDTLLPGE